MTDGDEDLVKACPECDSTRLLRRSGGGFHGRKPVAPYYCNSCFMPVEEPVERERHRARGKESGLAGELLDADPDDVSAEHAGGESA